MDHAETYSTVVGTTPRNSISSSQSSNTRESMEEVEVIKEFEIVNTPRITTFATHKAAQEGDFLELQRLFSEPDEDPLVEKDGMTPLHFAVNYGNPKLSHAMSEVILNCVFLDNKPDKKKTLIDTKNAKGETALHLAAKNVHRKTVELLLKNKADVNIKSAEDKEAIELVYEFVPHVMIPFFDDSVKNDGTEINEEKFKVKFNFGPIVGIPGPQDPMVFMETKLLKNALNGSPLKYEDLFLHPLVQVFLHYKWNKIRVLLVASILLHIAWLLFYTFFVVNLYVKNCPYVLPANTSIETDAFTETSIKVTEEISCPVEKLHVPLAWILLAASLLVALKEIYELSKAPTFKYYIYHLENLIQICVIIASCFAAIPVLINSCTPSILQSNEYTRLESNLSLSALYYQIAACGVFLSWTLILLQLGKTPPLGIYVQVLVKVIRSFGLFIATFVSLLIGFLFSFSILMPQNEKFSSFPFGLSKMLVMMAGELQYDDIFYNEDTNLRLLFPISTQIFFASFVIMVTIILFNLLIGFTVSDIQGLQQTATVFRLSKQLEQIQVMESFLFSSGLAWFLRLFKVKPESFRRRFMVTWCEARENASSVSLEITRVDQSAAGVSERTNIPNVEAISEDSTFLTRCVTNIPMETFPLRIERVRELTVVADATISATDSAPRNFSTSIVKTMKQIPKNLRAEVKDLVIRNLKGSGVPEGSQTNGNDRSLKYTFTEAELTALISKAMRESAMGNA